MARLLLCLSLVLPLSASAQVLDGVGVYAGVSVVEAPLQELPDTYTLYARLGPSLAAVWHTAGLIAPHVEMGYVQRVILIRGFPAGPDSLEVYEDYTDRTPIVYGVVAARLQRDLGPVRPFVYVGPRLDWRFQRGVGPNLRSGVVLGIGSDLTRAVGIPIAAEARVSRGVERVGDDVRLYLFEFRVGVYPFR